MKRYILTLVVTPLLLLFACAPADQDGVDDADTLGVDMEQEMTEFRAEVDEAMMDVDMRLDSLEAWAEMQGEEADEEVDSTLADLRERRDSLQQTLQQLGMATEETFEDMRADFERGVDDLERDVEDAWNRYGRDDADDGTM